MDLSKEFKKDLKIYKKNLKTAQAIIDLVNIYNDKNKSTSDCLDHYMSIIVEGLEDNSVRINYKGSIEEIIETLRNFRKEMGYKYRHLEHKKRVLFDEDVITGNLESGNYNLMEIINEHYLVSPWNTKLIVSHMPVEVRAEMYYDYVMSSKYSSPTQAICYLNVEADFPDEECPMERVAEMRIYMAKENPKIFDNIFKNLSPDKLLSMAYSLAFYFASPERVRYLLENKEMCYEYSSVMFQMMHSELYSNKVDNAQKNKDLNDFIDKISAEDVFEIYNLMTKDISKETIKHYAEAISNATSENNTQKVNYLIENVVKQILSRPYETQEEYVENVRIAKEFIDTVLDYKKENNKTLGLSK